MKQRLQCWGSHFSFAPLVPYACEDSYLEEDSDLVRLIRGDFPNQQTSPNMTTKLCHGSEVGLIFGTTSYTRKLPDMPEQGEPAKIMRQAWASFAKALETALDRLL